MPTKQRQIRWEISAVLAIKVCLLFVLWKLCFSHPTSHSVNPQRTAQHLLSSAPPSYLKGEQNGF